MATDPNHDAAALAASESKDQSPGGNLAKKHRKLIIFLILVVLFVTPLVAILFNLIHW